MIDEYGYLNGFVERKKGGAFNGNLTIEGINLSPIEGVYFKKDGKDYLWIKRKRILEYDHEKSSYVEREREPRFEAYLSKQTENEAVAYRGDFIFMRLRFSIVGVWDKVLGNDRHRLNLFIERMPMSKQTIINGIKERKGNL